MDNFPLWKIWPQKKALTSPAGYVKMGTLKGTENGN